jgi:iron-sulfur cluster repair protein YtfE (RIC family)
LLCVSNIAFNLLRANIFNLTGIEFKLKQKVVLNGAINKKTSKIEVIFEQSNQIESYKKASEEQGERLRS